MHRIPNDDAQHAGRHAGQYKLKGIRQRNRALRLAQHAQHGAVVQVFGGKPARNDGHCHGAEQGCQQGHEVEEFFGAVQRLAHLGAAAFQRLEPHASQLGLLDLLAGPLHIGFHCRVAAGHGKAVVGAAGRLDQVGRGEVGAVDHHARGKIDEARATVGLLNDDTRQLEARISHQQSLADLEAQRIEQRRVGPGRAGCRNIPRGCACAFDAVGHRHAAAQGVALGHGLESHEFAGTAVGFQRAAHGRKSHGRNRLQSQAARLGDKNFRRFAVAAKNSITAQQLPGVALQAALEAVGEKAYGRQGRHRQGDGNNQQTQLARAQVAQQGAPAEFQEKCAHSVTITQSALPGGMDGFCLSAWTPCGFVSAACSTTARCCVVFRWSGLHQ